MTITSARNQRPTTVLGLAVAAGAAGVAGLVAATMVTGVACTSTTRNGDHCFYNAGNATCEARWGGELPYCATQCAGAGDNPASPNGDGCVDWEPPTGCYSPCGDAKDVADDSTCLDTAGTDATTTMTTAPTSDATTGGPSTTGDVTTADTSVGDTEPVQTCSTSGDCTGADRPICSNDLCVPCDVVALPDAECAAKDPDLPACSPSGACVQCTDTNTNLCFAETPICTAEVCTACIAHAQCGDRPCELATGRCFPSTCNELVPSDDNPTLQDAVDDAIAANGRCTVRVTDDLLGTTADAIATVTGGDEIIAIVREGGAAPFTVGGGEGATLRVSGGATVYVEGLRLGQNPDDFGVVVTGAGTALYIEDTEVTQNAGGGISVQAGAYLRLRNSLVGGAPDLIAVQVLGSSTADLVYATVVGATGDATVLACDGAAGVVVRNSLLVGRGTNATDIQCNATVTYTAAEVLLGGMGNVTLGDLTAANQDTWFVGYAQGNYRLDAPPAALGMTAQWIEGDPLTDLDGDPRVAMDGALEWAGGDAL